MPLNKFTNDFNVCARGTTNGGARMVTCIKDMIPLEEELSPNPTKKKKLHLLTTEEKGP